MKEKNFYLQGSDAGKECFTGSKAVNFEWNIIYDCNYRCPHCIFEGKWDEYKKRTVFLSPDEWMNHWRRIHSLYGRASFLITGGEPFLYPGFIDVIENLSEIHYPINISSNSSGDMREFAARIDPAKVSVAFSFQPLSNKLEDVIEKQAFLASKGFIMGTVNLCVYPPYLKQLENYVSAAHKSGVLLKIIPFCGEYQGSRYPESYSAEEKAILGIDEKWENNVKRKGKLCTAGQRSALIFPDGKVARCGRVGERLLLGNIFSENFRLFDSPMECDVDLCPCIEGDLA